MRRGSLRFYCIAPFQLMADGPYYDTGGYVDPGATAYTNAEAIAINQDSLVTPAQLLGTNAFSATVPTNQVVLTRKLSNGDVALCVWNMTTNTTPASSTVTITLPLVPGLRSASAAVRDCLGHSNFMTSLSLSATVPMGGAALYRLSPTNYMWDPDASSYLTRAGYALTPADTNSVAVNTLVGDLKACGAWTNYLLIYPFLAGTNSATASGYNLKTNQYDIAWTGSPVLSPTGMVFTADAGQSGNTGFTPSSSSLNGVAYSTASAHLGAYVENIATPTDGTALHYGCFWGSGDGNYMCQLGGGTRPLRRQFSSRPSVKAWTT